MYTRVLSRNIIADFRAQNTEFRKHVDRATLYKKVNNLLNNEQK